MFDKFLRYSVVLKANKEKGEFSQGQKLLIYLLLLMDLWHPVSMNQALPVQGPFVTQVNRVLMLEYKFSMKHSCLKTLMASHYLCIKDKLQSS